jgi:exopolysaccharide biosynthesis polyprenyl glycosylphosphotransferase
MNQLAISRPHSQRLHLARGLFARRTAVFQPGSLAAPISGAPWARAYCTRLRVTDLAVLVVALSIAFVARAIVEPESLSGPGALQRDGVLSLLLVGLWIASLSIVRTLDLKVVGFGAGEYKRVVNSSMTVFGLIAIIFVIAEVHSARWFFMVAFPLGLLGLLLERWLWRQWLIRQRTFGHYLSRVIVVGRRDDVEKVVRQMDRNSGAAYTVIGAVLDGVDAESDNGALRNVTVMRDLDRVTEYATRLGADGIVVAGQPGNGNDFIHDLAWELEGKTVELILATSLANVAGPRIHFRPVDGLPLLHVEIPQFEGGKHVLKRIMDISVSSIALVLLSPLFLVLAILIRLDSTGKAIFSQERIGRDGSTFSIYKFRSMVADAPERLAALAALNEGSGVLFKLHNDPRVTRVGRVIRKFSLDELPQLWNVLIGDMSIVGPRPPLANEVAGYDRHVHRRLYIKPGLTGMWQINGRSALSWDESVRLDLYYVENWSVIGDLVIMWRTFRVLLHPVGAY